jgi:prepilin-type N-terminal cleavage/methylation domain-containing protein
MANKLTKKSEGFTIIEVLIVLAIAGLIMLIVFLAVPALQRNSRNTQRRNDVAALLAGVNDFATNNNGTLPTSLIAVAGSPGTLEFGCSGGTCTTSQAKVGYFNKGIGTSSGQVSILTAYANTGPFNTAAQDYVVIVPAASCATTNASQAGAARGLAAVYEIENGNNQYAAACSES